MNSLWLMFASEFSVQWSFLNAPRVGGTATGFAIFLMAPFLFTYKPDVGMVNNYIIIGFCLMTSKLSLSIRIIVRIH